ncbi:DUF5702 domain-containing protein [Pseudobutyrivibrio xylanivorans]|uniref:Uncharacterized protein n=1 Tax=Pseudobutyrivibrio xylanivorans TaxID=185007 RepID=A0A5P6VNT5_PSEXY|nr:DUF5702 domain-containing protein [Pseudobutyrivibrio xylanivorans]QFJ54072.1 hypothetical protein FXF36_03895 [Pseudobutyrivibrio xylanivorans]
MQKKLKGSLSVFFALIMVAVMGLIFTMSECIRLYELHAFAQEYTDMAVDSAFSEYNPYLWTNYKILAVDLGYGSENKGPGIMEQKTLDYCKYNSSVESGHNYARLSTDGCKVNRYSVLTDSDGAAIITLGAKAAKEGMAAQIIDGVQGHIDSINNIEKISVEDKANSAKKSLNDAKRDLERKKREAEEDDDPRTKPEDYPSPGRVEDNPLDAFDVLKESFSRSVLATVTNVDSVSEKEVVEDQLPSHRTLSRGNMQQTTDAGIVDKALFIDYLLTNYSRFDKDRKHDGLKYEVEYLVAGQHTDSQNLARVVEEILFLREAANFATIMSSTLMQKEAYDIAVVLAGFTGNPVIIEALQAGIIAAWAYAESTLDVRLLLCGGKVPAVKNLDQWTSDIWHLSSMKNVNVKAKNVDSGLTYKDFLSALLAVHSKSKIAMRALDVMEIALNSTEDYKAVKVDNMLWAADVELSFSASEMFLSIFSRNQGTAEQIPGQYYFAKTRYLSY